MSEETAVYLIGAAVLIYSGYSIGRLVAHIKGSYAELEAERDALVKVLKGVVMAYPKEGYYTKDTEINIAIDASKTLLTLLENSDE